MSEVLLSVEEAAQRLGGVSRWSIYAWMSQGRLRKTKIGSRVMIADRDLHAFIASCNPEPDVSVRSDSAVIERGTVPAVEQHA